MISPAREKPAIEVSRKRPSVSFGECLTKRLDALLVLFGEQDFLRVHGRIDGRVAHKIREDRLAVPPELILPAGGHLGVCHGFLESTDRIGLASHPELDAREHVQDGRILAFSALDLPERKLERLLLLVRTVSTGESQAEHLPRTRTILLVRRDTPDNRIAQSIEGIRRGVQIIHVEKPPDRHQQHKVRAGEKLRGGEDRLVQISHLDLNPREVDQGRHTPRSKRARRHQVRQACGQTAA